MKGQLPVVDPGKVATTGSRRARPGIFEFPPFRLDGDNEQLWRTEQLISLRRKPFAILRYLLERPGQLITKQELLSQLWPDEYVGEGVLKTYLSEIRTILDDSVSAPRYIETAYGRGYRFIGTLSDPGHTNGTASSVRGLPPSLPPPPDEPPTFVGRQQELRRLEDALDKALARQRQVLFITGEAGIGKTLLVQTFLERVAGRGDTLVAWGQCVDQYGAGEPYLPVLEAIGRACRGPDAALVRELLRERAPNWLSLLPSVARAEATPQQERFTAPERMLREMAEALEALSEGRLLILWLEDLHWADPSTLDLLSYLAQRRDPARLLVLGSQRSREAHDARRLLDVEQHLRLRDAASELALPYLPAEAVAAYLAARFEHAGFPAALAPLLQQLTSGNPLFMARVVDSWIEQGHVERGLGGWQLRRELRELSQGVPETLARMIAWEVERLGEFERSVLEAASVAGLEFSSAVLAAAIGEDIVRIESLCTRWGQRGQFLRLHGKVEWPDHTTSWQCEFRHALYRHVVYDQIGAARQRQLHQRIGERLEAAHASALPDIAAELALHFERGGDARRAIGQLRLAASHALERSAYREATEHFQKALELLPQLGEAPDARELELELCVCLGTPLTVIRGYAHPEVERVYLRARELCQGQGETPHLAAVLAGIGGFFIVRGAYLEGVQICEQMLVLARRYADVQVEAAALLGLGLLRLFHGDLLLACEHFEQVLLSHHPGRQRVHILHFKQDPSVVARCFLAYALALLGYPDRALTQAEECVAIGEDLGQPFAVAFGLLGLAFVHQFRGEYLQAQRRAGQLLELCKEHGFKLHEALAILARGEASVGCGQLEMGVQLLSNGWQYYRLTGAELGATYWQARLVEAHALSGDGEAARNMLEQARGKVQALDEHWWEAELDRLEGELVAARTPALAEQSFCRALHLARQRSQRSLELRAALSLARHWQGQGRNAEARELLQPVLASFTEGFDTLDYRTARTLLQALGGEG